MPVQHSSGSSSGDEFSRLAHRPSPSLRRILLQSPLQARDEQAATVTAQAPEPDWAFETSDLPVDPAYRFGTLDNGMRYIIRRNATPAGQAMVWMRIDGGSLSEHDAERGYAHFIEHMAFNGSTHIPEGEMVKLLEREGLAFGADTNASTGFDQTIYKLNLPRNDGELLDTSLMLMREIASELTFDQAAIDREKGVVLSEKRVGDTYAYRNMLDNLEFQYPGARLTGAPSDRHDRDAAKCDFGQVARAVAPPLPAREHGDRRRRRFRSRCGRGGDSPALRRLARPAGA